MKFSGKLVSVEKAILADAPSIGTFQREKSKDFAEGLIMGWLVYLNNLLGLNNKMSEEQIELCAQRIVEDYYMMKMSDLTLLFKRIISGDNGKFYERLSISDVLSFFKDYMDERIETAENISIREHQDSKSLEHFNYTNNIQRMLQTGAKKSK